MARLTQRAAGSGCSPSREAVGSPGRQRDESGFLRSNLARFDSHRCKRAAHAAVDSITTTPVDVNNGNSPDESETPPEDEEPLVPSFHVARGRRTLPIGEG
jgi:hypothetical protein